MANALPIVYPEDDTRDFELMAVALCHAGIDCEVARVDTRDQFIETFKNPRFARSSTKG